MEAIRASLSSILGQSGLHIFTSMQLGLTSLIFFVSYICMMLYFVNRSRKGLPMPKIRRLPGLDAIDEVIGRGTEMGRPISYIPGTGGLTAPTFAGLGILSSVSKSIAKYDARMVVYTGNVQVFPIAQSTVRQSYSEIGKSDSFREEDVMFLTNDDFGFTTAVSGAILRENISGQLMMGPFGGESLRFSEIGNWVGAIQVAGTPDLLQIPFFITACDYTLIGEELYAASAYLTHDAPKTATIIVQDRARVFVFCLMVLGVISVTIASVTGSPTHFIAELLRLY